MKSEFIESSGEQETKKRFCYVRWEEKEEKRGFAVEAERSQMMKSLGKNVRRLGCSIAAFSILDDSVHLLLYAEDEWALTKQNMGRELLESSTLYLPEAVGGAGALKENGGGWNISSGSEAMRFAADIHMLPVRKRYVMDLNDYWFSSWQTYRGEYVWDQVAMDGMLRGISRDREEALLLFRKYQKLQALRP